MSVERRQTQEPSKRSWISFWALIGMQTTNAFNDNFVKFILIPLGVGLASIGFAPDGLEYLLGLLLVLPFVFLAPSAGWLADRFPKNLIIRWSSWFQLAVLVLMSFGLWIGVSSEGDGGGVALPLVIFAFFLLAVQSALLSPAKMGVVKELLGSSRLGFANGLMEGTAILAILLGQIIGGIWFDKWGLQVGRGIWQAAFTPVLWILIGGVLSIFLSHAIEPTKAAGAEPFKKKIVLRHFVDLRIVRSDVAMWRSALGIAFFWGFGGFLQLLLIQIAQERKGSLAGMGVETAILWMPVVLGIVFGSLLASWICGRRNELGLVVVGGLLMSVATVLLAFLSSGISSYGLLAIAGCGGALFMVPLNAYLQDRAPESERGLVISASNLCNNLAGVFAVVAQMACKKSGMPAWIQFLVLGGLCAWVSLYLLRLLPKDFLRLVVLGVFRSIYRIRSVGHREIPSEGGVLLVANHLTYIDAFVLSASCPRPIRFLMFADCFENKWVGFGARLFDALPISSTRARDAIVSASEALKQGAVVCVFPEGQLSRTGGLSEIKRGYQMIAKKAGCPVIPAYMDGLWGSIWSFSEGNFLKKYPRTLRFGVSVAFGAPIEPEEDLGAALRRLSTLTLEEREHQWFLQKNGASRLLSDLPEGWVEMEGLCWEDSQNGCSMRKNALQLGQVHLASQRSRMLVEWVPGDELSGVLGILWPFYLGASVCVLERPSCDVIAAKVQELHLDVVVLRTRQGREQLVDQLAQRGIFVLIVDEEARSNGEYFGCLVRNQRVVSYALAHPDYETSTRMPQSGWKSGSRGKLLPGLLQEEFGPLDKEGFLVDSVPG